MVIYNYLPNSSHHSGVPMTDKLDVPCRSGVQAMTKEQDIVEQLLGPWPMLPKDHYAYDITNGYDFTTIQGLMRDAAYALQALAKQSDNLNKAVNDLAKAEHDAKAQAAQTIAALRAERDEAKERTEFVLRENQGLGDEICSLSERKTELEEGRAYDAMMADQLCSALERREERIKELRSNWQECGELLDTAMRERDEARRALEPFAEQASRYDPVEGDDDHPLWGAHTLTIGDVRRARSASSNREDGEE
jgi:DNA repair exonuclease SbcCD ATPase subunit